MSLVHHTHKSYVRAIITEPIIWAGVRCGLIGGEKEEREKEQRKRKKEKTKREKEKSKKERERRNIRYVELNDEDEEKLYAHTNCNDSLLLNPCQSIFGLLLVLKTESDAYSPVIYSGSNRENQRSRERERGSNNT